MGNGQWAWRLGSGVLTLSVYKMNVSTAKTKTNTTITCKY